MSDLKSYTIEINGIDTTLQLSDEDAKLRGLIKVDTDKPAAATKGRTPANKAVEPDSK